MKLCTKVCTICGAPKELAEFYNRRGSRDGKRAECKSCVDSRNRAWNSTNATRRSAAATAWLLAHPEANKLASRKYRINNKEKRAECCKRWNQNNKERYYANNAASKKRYPERFAARQRAREAIKLLAMPKWVDMQSIQKIYDEANRLTEQTGIRHDVDHIVPLKSKRVCGLHVEHNLQVIPMIANISKGNRRWPDMP